MNDPVKLLAETEVLISNPKLGDMLAETEPELIWDKFRPVIPAAGIPNRFAPDPENVPSFKLTAEPVMFKLPVNVCVSVNALPKILELLKQIPNYNLIEKINFLYPELKCNKNIRFVKICNEYKSIKSKIDIKKDQTV